jgi:hypothetical protein
VVLTLAALVGCAGDEDATGTTPAPSDVGAASLPARTSTPVTGAEDPPDGNRPTSDPAPTVAVTAGDTIATVPEQLAPGIDSDDPFCRAWSEFAGSFQALTFASIAAEDALAAARLEVLAADAVVSAVQTLDDSFPDEIADERTRFVDEVVGPFARRSGRAVDELRAAGLAEGDLDSLGRAWLMALAAADGTEPMLDVDVPSELDAAVQAATASFAAAVPPIAADPSLVTDAAAPATLAYLAERCPDQGVLAGNDAIG